MPTVRLKNQLWAVALEDGKTLLASDGQPYQLEYWTLDNLCESEEEAAAQLAHLSIGYDDLKIIEVQLNAEISLTPK